MVVFSNWLACTAVPVRNSRQSGPPTAASTPKGGRPPPPLRNDCYEVAKVPVISSYWFGVTDDFKQLSDAIRYLDAHDQSGPIASDPCSPAKTDCADWGFFLAQEANWEFKRIAGKVVSTRKTRGGNSDETYLKTTVVGNFVVGVLGKNDYLCPISPTEHCYPNEEPAPLLCESDFSIPCTREGDEITLEVLDVPKALIYRVETIRHLKTWRPIARDKVHISIVLDDCVVNI